MSFITPDRNHPTISRPTMEDVARLSGVARSTVAHILGGRAGYNEMTRKRVLETAQELGYRPNRLSHAFRQGKTMTVALVVESLQVQAQIVKVEGAETAAHEAGYLAYLVGWGDSASDRHPPGASGPKRGLIRCLHDMMDRRVDGVMLFGQLEPAQEIVDQLGRLPMPVVYVGWSPSWSDHVVIEDRRQAFDHLARYLRDLGHRRAAITVTPFMLNHPNTRLDPVRQACEGHGIELDTSPRWSIQLSENETRHGDYVAATRRVVSQAIAHKALPSVLFTANDDCAVAAVSECQRAGLAVPRDLSVVGFDDAPVGAAAFPTLTTIRQPGLVMGQVAFDMLHRLMKGAGEPLPAQEFACELIVRESTGPAPD
jgi:LacI family transcriptional regulator